VSRQRAQVLALRRRLLSAEAALQRARLRHEVATIGAVASPATWIAQASRHWPWLSLAASTLLRRRSTPALVVSALVLGWRWWRRLRRKP
jgi:hypothetical protein